MSKYATPCVVIVQYAAQLAYPSPRNLCLRKVLFVGYVAAGLVMCYTSGCTDVIRAHFPEPHSTLRWGGYSSPALPILLVSAATIANFFVVVDDWIVLAVLVVPFLCVITILWATEGTLALGSKWCTYCLIYSILFLAAPWWDKRRWTDPESRVAPSSPVVASREETKEDPDVEAAHELK